MTQKWKKDFSILNSENLKLILNYYATELNFDFQIEEFFPKGDLHLIHADSYEKQLPELICISEMIFT